MWFQGVPAKSIVGWIFGVTPICCCWQVFGDPHLACQTMSALEETRCTSKTQQFLYGPRTFEDPTVEGVILSWCVLIPGIIYFNPRPSFKRSCWNVTTGDFLSYKYSTSNTIKNVNLRLLNDKSNRDQPWLKWSSSLCFAIPHFCSRQAVSSPARLPFAHVCSFAQDPFDLRVKMLFTSEYDQCGWDTPFNPKYQYLRVCM